MASNEKHVSGIWNFVLIGLAALLAVMAWFVPSPTASYVAVMATMIVFMAVLGVRISGRWAGILVNDRNLMSLSRFQLVLWTVVILSALLVSIIARVRTGSIVNALDIGLDEKLWALMGISTASLIGTPLINGTKKSEKPEQKILEKTATQTEETAVDVKSNSQGVLYSNPEIKDAAFSDMFEGDEIGNTMYVDLAKVQMFFFTVVAVLSYGVALFKWLETEQFLQVKVIPPATQPEFPALSGGLIAVLGISHAGFLINKSTTHTPTEGK